MVSSILVDAIHSLVDKLSKERQVYIQKAALTPAYEGAVPGLFTLTTLISNASSCDDKIECLIEGLHTYVALNIRKSIASVRVFDSESEFDYFVKTGYGFGTCEPCMQHMQPFRQDLMPELIEMS